MNPYINTDREQNIDTKGDNQGMSQAQGDLKYSQNRYAQNNSLFSNFSFLPNNFNTSNFITGVLVGAGFAYIMTNEKAQQALFKAIVKAGNLLQAGTEELKERFEDAKAEVDANK